MDSIVVSWHPPIALPCDQSGTEGTHDTGDIRADASQSADLLKTAENRVVVEGTALYDHVFAELGGVGNLDNLKQGVFDDGVSQSGGDIGDGSALFLRLFDLGVHENSTAGTEVGRIFGKELPPWQNPVRCSSGI